MKIMLTILSALATFLALVGMVISIATHDWFYAAIFAMNAFAIGTSAYVMWNNQ
jgi:hypothetical protein